MLQFKNRDYIHDSFFNLRGSWMGKKVLKWMIKKQINSLL